MSYTGVQIEVKTVSHSFSRDHETGNRLTGMTGKFFSWLCLPALHLHYLHPQCLPQSMPRKITT